MPQLHLDLVDPRPTHEALAPGALLLRSFAADADDVLLDAIADVIRAAPLRHMTTPGGHRMSVAMTSCGALGWTSDARGYRYAPRDPASGRPWPALPALFLRLAQRAASEAGFPPFVPDSCLVNRYEPGARMTLHQDRNELDMRQPIVSVSLGLPATFLLGGERRSDRPTRIDVRHGDVVVWGGPARLLFHGVLPLPAGHHPRTGSCRINLTFRRAGPVEG